MEGKLKESGGYSGWHEQLLTEKQDLLVTIATLVLRTLVCRCVYSLFVQSSSCWKKKRENSLAEAFMLTFQSPQHLLLLFCGMSIEMYICSPKWKMDEMIQCFLSSVKWWLRKSVLRHTVCSSKDVIVSVPVSGGDNGPHYSVSTQPEMFSSLFCRLFLIKRTDKFGLNFRWNTQELVAFYHIMQHQDTKYALA